MNKNVFEDYKAVPQPPIVRPQAWGDNTPRGTDMKKSILADVQKLVVVGDVKNA